ncbi:ectoine/hydroxyectoine ABC transporter permease subunit EhuD [Rhizobium sp. 1AS11]|uniref:ectoine/hydroxyectoine ABC transporter permease subunit EhuD n=1 Tax=Rhizobium acaciae TaxID=2989736 RepID=UPI002223A8A5|nr:ectoine/hydroxyectoine ABC transporter permease subunit EhuD [Rhizobium acaciae]MCW1410678.1 ectoine/hydroxyectoine ABC transporter permease subunit EhuD [Rhizobium acaciae]MCW1743023.1 ectoine/hydroxyectoine ABC transporter permease subunit EhuD [Rhizobium acaciae]
MNWSWDFARQIAPALIQGLIVTVEITLVASVVAMVIGLLFAVAKMSPVKWLRHPAVVITEGIRRTPLLVQLYFLFYVLPDLGVLLSPFVAGVIGLGLHYGTYLSEVYRAGIINVPTGQWEAARACNLTTRQTWTEIILPQAIPPMIPPLGNYVIAMFKETPILSAITVMDLMGEALAQANFNYRYLEPITLVAAGFLLVSLVSAAAIKLLEKHLKLRAA